MASFKHQTDIYVQMKILALWLQLLKTPFECFHLFFQQNVIIIPYYMFFSEDMLYGNPICGCLDVRSALISCRHCAVQRHDLCNSYYDVEKHQKTKIQFLQLYAEVKNKDTKKEKAKFLQHGLNEKQSPLLQLKTLLIPSHVSNQFIS